MSDDEDMTQTGFQVPEEDLEKAKRRAEFGELSEELRKTVRRLAYGREKTRREELKDELEEEREEDRRIQREINALKEEQQDVQRNIRDLENQLDDIRDSEAEYEGMLEAISSDLREGTRVTPDATKIEKAAEAGGKTTGEVMNDLRERNPEVPECAYRLAEGHEPGNWKDAVDQGTV